MLAVSTKTLGISSTTLEISTKTFEVPLITVTSDQRTDNKQHIKNDELVERIIKQSYSVRDDENSDKFATVETRSQKVIINRIHFKTFGGPKRLIIGCVIVFTGWWVLTGGGGGLYKRQVTVYPGSNPNEMQYLMVAITKCPNKQRIGIKILIVTRSNVK